MQIYIEQIENIIEAVLFASGEPVSLAEIAAALEIDRDDAHEIILKFAENYNAKKTGLEVLILAENAQIVARAAHIGYIRKVLKSDARRERVLSKVSLEILAIVAYNQPVTRCFVEQVRGVDSTYTLGNLIDRGYIEEAGHLEVAGRPKLYGTTVKFLAQFGLKDLSELPDIEQFKNKLKAAPDGE